MFRIGKIFLLALFVTVAMAQTPELPLSDTRLSIHTLVREDVFAGFLANDMTRLARGEKNIRLLLEKRPGAKPDLLAWQAGVTMFRAVLAYENQQADEFQKQYKQAADLFAQARQAGPDTGGVSAVTGGVYALFADRLPKEYQAAAWAQAYDSYQNLWKMQAPAVDKLPVHMRGELLGGLAMSATRAGHPEEAGQYLDKILTALAGTPYESAAKKWKENPKSGANASVACLTCHEPGRLSARLTALNSGK
jgi:hypothetical protein